MLILARKPGQVLKIGQEITVTVLEVRGDTVRLGIDAPRALAVHRLEIYQEIERENRQAAAPLFKLEDLTALKSRRS